MSLKLDHIFIITEPGAAVGDQLVQKGLREGPANRHPGQGTANRRFYFNGFVLEFLFVADAAEARNGAGRDLGIWQRSQTAAASPYGLVVRVEDTGAEPTFKHWCYYPDYFNGKMCFFVGDNSSLLSEPLCICMPPALPEKPVADTAEYNNDRSLTGAKLSSPVAALSPVLKDFARIPNLSLQSGMPHHLELEFNHATNAQSADLRPELPLSLRW
jgi:hypothetical protein